MQKLSSTQITVINVSLLIFGLGIVAYGLAAVSNPVLSGWLNALGTTLAVTGSVDLLQQVLREKPHPLGPELVAMKRKSMPQSIHSRKETAVKIDMLGVSLTDFLEEILHDRKQTVLRHVLYEPDTRIRVMFANLHSPFLHQRSYEDGNPMLEPLRNRQYQCIEYCVRIYAVLDAHYQEERKRNPNFEPHGTMSIKLLEACLYLSYERYDYDIYWGLYTSDSAGKNAPVFLTTSKDGEMYEKLKAHFIALYDNGYEEFTRSTDDKSSSHNTILQVTHQGPWLNESLVISLLGAEKYAELKKEVLLS